jgi:GntR family transcriptional regulator, transcriptional repressor for pyruvate dehydrogenase complex
MLLRAVKKTRIHEEIIAQIREELADGRLKAGDRLPSERELSEKFEVSRASVREAIRALESMGLVTIRTGDGTYVASGSEILLSPLVSIILQQKELLLDIFEARKVIEPEIAALAATRATPEDVRQMEEMLEEQARQIAQGGSGVEADTAFHSILTQSTKNKVILRLNDAIVDSLLETRERSLHVHGRPARSLAGHREILEAIRSKNPSEARNAMLSHLIAIEQNILNPSNSNTRRRSIRSRRSSFRP